MTNKTWIQVAERLWEISQEKKELAKQEAILKKTLIELSNNQSHAEGDYMFKLSLKKGSIDYRSIPALREINLEQFRKEDIKSWSLVSVKD